MVLHLSQPPVLSNWMMTPDIQYRCFLLSMYVRCFYAKFRQFLLIPQNALVKMFSFIHVIGLRYTVCSVPASADPLNHIGGPAPHYRPGKFTCSTTKNQETITTLREIST
jgi:hypothetical protein